MLSSVLLVILILMLLGALPAWPHSRMARRKSNATKGLEVAM